MAGRVTKSSRGVIAALPAKSDGIGVPGDRKAALSVPLIPSSHTQSAAVLKFVMKSNSPTQK